MHNNETTSALLQSSVDRHNAFFHCSPPKLGNTAFHTPGESAVFGYVTGGCGHIETAEKRYTASAGSFFFIGRDTGAYLYQEGEAPWEKLWIHAEGSLTEDLIRAFRLSPVTVAEGNVRRQFIELCDTLSAEDMGRAACLLFEVLTEVRREELFSADRGEQKSGTAEAIRAFIDGNLYDDISLDTLAAVFDRSKMHVIRLFKKAFGTTPMQYQLDRRVAVAKSLLSGTVMPIREISELLRFSTTQHFTNTFKKAEGISPGKYRQSIQNGK